MRQNDYNSVDRKADRAAIIGFFVVLALTMGAIALTVSMMGGTVWQ